MRNTSILVCLLSLSFTIFAQKVTETTIDGVKYYVYPFNNRVSYQNNYFDAFAKSKLKGAYSWNYEILEAGVDKKMLKKMQKQYEKSMRKEQRYDRSYNRDNAYLRSKKFLNAIRNNPKQFVYANYSLESDITPSLDPIPNGKYIQYFDTIWLLKPNGDFEKKQLIAGRFEIKNNKLEGEAVWFGPWGDTLKHGFYIGGVKVGEWEITSKIADRYLSKKDVKAFEATGVLKVDTIREIYTYKDGINNGKYQRYYNSKYPVQEGEYLDNLQVGTWVERASPTTDDYTSASKRIKWDNNIVVARYTIQENGPVVKKPMIRFRQIPALDEGYLIDNYNFEPEYIPYIDFYEMSTLTKFKKTETLNMEEEEINSYEGGEYYEGDYYEDGYYEDEYYDEDQYQKEFWDEKSNDYVSMAKMIDSIGYYLNFKGTYERFYPNGQLMVRYQFNDDGLVAEDTIFYDNGKPFDVITFDKDSSQFHQVIYDYDGKLYKDIVFDAKGEFVKVAFEQDLSSKIAIANVTARREGPEDQYYRFEGRDTLSSVLKDSVLLYSSWFHRDTALIFQESYIPSEKKLVRSTFSIMGNKVTDDEMFFADNFESWTGTSNYKIGDLRLETKSSGAMNFLMMNYYGSKALFDSIPQLAVEYYGGWYQTTSSEILYNKEVPFGGKLNMKFTDSKLSLKSSSRSISMGIPKELNQDKLQWDVLKYEEKGKTKHDLLFSVIDETSLSFDSDMIVYYDLFDNVLNRFASPPYNYYDSYEDLGRRRGKEYRREFYPEMTSAKGSYLAGKASGLWTVSDQKGKKMVEVPFADGEINGKVKYYSYMQGRNPYYESRKDTLPKKQVYFFSGSDDYKNGLQHGKSIEYNWLGEVTRDFTYVDGMKQGPGYERNKFAHSSMSFLNDALDGYLNTYLTLPGKDSLLIYNLNFKNGLLQGESKAYHTNGRLAKRGFFLDGRPIDDYEAFDTLGFKYHYVKFMYSFPIEEKIWEENQLSVRYLFDWRDSIYFNAEDLTTSQSLERVLFSYGIGGQQIEQPYYGRASIIEKNGIDYHMTKYYPNDTVARDGLISKGKKVGCWKFYSYEGELLYEVDYHDSIIKMNDSIQFASKGILIDYDKSGKKISESFIIEKFEKYDCSHTDHYEIRQLKTIWTIDSVDRMNGYVKNYYDNGVLQNEGMMKDGNPTGVWKFYDPYGKLNQVGEYVSGKRHGRWLAGDLAKTKFLGEICLNPNLPNLEEEIAYREKLLDILITNYKYGKALNKEYYDINLNLYEEEGENIEIIEEEGE